MVLISLAIHESESSFLSLINNLKYFTKNAIIIIHVSKSFKLKGDYSKIEDLYFNEVSLETGYLDGSLFLCHLSNIKFAKSKKLDYEFFVPFGSNQMLIKSGLEDFIKNQQVRRPVRLNFRTRVGMLVNFNFIFKNILRSYGLYSLYKHAPEGTYWPKYMIDRHFKMLESIGCTLEKYCGFDRPNGYWSNIKYTLTGKINFPAEEIIFPTLFYNLEKGNFEGEDYCYKNWKDDLKISLALVKRLQCQNGFFSVKRVHRNMNKVRLYLDGFIRN